MRNEQDIKNLRDQYLEQLAFIKNAQTEYSKLIDSSKGIIIFFEVPLIKALQEDIERLNWVLGEVDRYPGSHYRTDKPEFTFDSFVAGLWDRRYNASYDMCSIHGTFERGTTCLHCCFDYKSATANTPISSPKAISTVSCDCPGPYHIRHCALSNET